jgi:hypothetical protein
MVDNDAALTFGPVAAPAVAPEALRRYSVTRYGYSAKNILGALARAIIENHRVRRRKHGVLRLGPFNQQSRQASHVAKLYCIAVQNV